MGLFDRFKKSALPTQPGQTTQPGQSTQATPPTQPGQSPQSGKPYKDEGLNKIYQLLFCDNIELYRSGNDGSVYPWDLLLSDAPNIDRLKEVAGDKTLESRQRALADHRLLKNGSAASQKELRGVIVEVGLPQGLDVLASFSDGTARYLNHSGKILVWETRTEQSNQLIGELFSHSINIVNKIGPWDKERKAPPLNGMVRLTFLVSDGLYFGEGPFEALQKDAMGGPVIAAATKLMTYLTSQPPPSKG